MKRAIELIWTNLVCVMAGFFICHHITAIYTKENILLHSIMIAIWGIIVVMYTCVDISIYVKRFKAKSYDDVQVTDIKGLLLSYTNGEYTYTTNDVTYKVSSFTTVDEDNIKKILIKYDTKDIIK